MSIEHTGPRAYDYQYLATATAAVAALASFDEVLAIYPEKPGGEDAELLIRVNGIVEKIEIQVKSQIGDFDNAALAGVLCHFPAHKDTGNLLQRLIDESQTHLIVVTGGRCTESAAYAGKPGNFDELATVPSFAPLLPTVAAFNATETSRLKSSRARYCQQQAHALAQPGVIPDFLKKVRVWENLNVADMMAHIQHLLFRKLGVAMLQTETALDDIIKLVKAGRDEHSDIALRLQELLQKYQHKHPVFQQAYIVRPEEHTLVQQLEQQHYLLLAGRSLCGKSTLAKALAKQLTLCNYELLATHLVEDAERFLMDTNAIDRICFLDDPMGHFYAELSSDDSWLRIQRLCQNLPAGKKLIVTANNDLLNRLQLPTGGHWHDLTTNDRLFLKTLLKSLGDQRGLPAETVARIANYLDESADDRLMQPGQLDYLINNWQAEYLQTGTDLYAIAATDAHRIAVTVRSKGPLGIRLYRLMGLVSDINTSLAEDDLRYLLTDDQAFPAIFFERRIDTVSFGDLMSRIKEDSADFPEYHRLADLPDEIQALLDFFYQCGFIDYQFKRGYRFRHPLYYEAAKLLLQNIEPTKTNDLLNLSKRTCACLAVPNTLMATKQLAYLFAVNPSNERLRQGLVEIAFFAAECIFPAVQDAALIFLASQIAILTAEQAEEVQNRLLHYTGGSSSLCWHNGRPYRPKDHTFQQSPDLLFKTLSDEEFVTATAQFLDNQQPLPSPEQAWWYALYIRKKSKLRPLQIDAQILLRLLNYDEAFIRSIVAYQCFYQFNLPPGALTERIFNDPHPFVVYQGIKGFVRGWPSYDQPTRDRLLPRILIKLAEPSIIVAATNFLTQFGIGYASHSFDWRDEVTANDKAQMWSLWPGLIKVFFEQAPPNLRFNADRFLATVDDAGEMLPKPTLPPLILGWIKWMKRTPVYMTYDPTLFSVVRSYMELIDQLNEVERLVFAKELLFDGSNSFIAECVRYYLAYWDQLYTTEQDQILILFRDRDPQNIFKAIALTGKGRPGAIQQFITGNDGWDQLSVPEMISTLSPELLRDCLAVAFLSYRFVETSNRDRQHWNQILGYFITQPGNVYCLLALKILLDDLSHRTNHLENSWGDPKTVVENLIDGPGINEYLFYLLLRDITEVTCSNTEKRWRLLLEKTNRDFREFALTNIVKAIERIEMHDNFELVYNLLGDSLFVKMPVDGVVRLLLKSLKSFSEPDPDLIKKASDMFEVMLNNDQEHFRLGKTYDLIISFIKKYTTENTDFLARAEAKRHDYYDRIRTEPIAEIRAKVWEPFEFMNVNHLFWAV